MLPNDANALGSARTIQWLMSTSKPNGRIQCNVLSGGCFGVDDGLDEIFRKRKQQSTQRREEKEERREEAYRAMLMDGTAFAIDCANPLIVADS